MIIVKTTNGDRFINEAETLQVNHNRDKAEVEVWPSRWGNQQQTPQYYLIEHVEMVVYLNDKQPAQWTDEGSALEKLKAELSDQVESNSEMRENMITLQQERDELEEKLARARCQGDSPQADGCQGTVPKASKKLEWHAISPILGDCTQTFDVVGCDGMPFADFLMQAIRHDRYVSLDFKCNGMYVWRGRYDDERVNQDDAAKMPAGIQGTRVQSARCNGGWGQMSYDVVLYPCEELKNKE